MSIERQEAQQRGEVFKEQLIEKLDWLDPEEAASELGCSVKQLHEHIAAKNLVGIEYNEHTLIPQILLPHGKLLPHLDTVIRSMYISSPWLQLSWLIAPNSRLNGKSPLEALDTCPEEVFMVAKGVGIQGGA